MTDTASAPRALPAFPLPPGHRFGLNPGGDLQLHDGRENYTDQHYLRQWQRAYALTDREYPSPSGVFDGPTQRAAIAVQRHVGALITAEVDPDTWMAVFDGRMAPKPSPYVSTVPPGLGKFEGVIDTQTQKNSRARERAAESNTNKIIYRNRHRGETPSWYALPDVDKINAIRSILGLRPGKASADVVNRIKGIQRAGGIAVTGTVDVATAWLIEESVVR